MQTRSTVLFLVMLLLLLAESSVVDAKSKPRPGGGVYLRGSSAPDTAAPIVGIAVGIAALAALLTA